MTVEHTVRIAILGPTASGKSALAVAVARHLGVPVVNGDPFQAIQGLAIGTGQPDAQEQGGVPHLGYGVLPPSTRPNPAEFGALVRSWLAPLPGAVLVTGSGLYLRGIWDQLTDLPEVPGDLVDRVRAWGQAVPFRLLHRYLAAVDPRRAEALHPNDGSRIQRALALHLATGQRPSDLLTGVQAGVPEGWRALVVLPERERQRARVTARVAAMVAAGWREEVATLLAAGHGEDLAALRPLGYLDWATRAPGVQSRIVTATQAYARRQATFFLNQWPGLPTWDPDRESLACALERLRLR